MIIKNKKKYKYSVLTYCYNNYEVFRPLQQVDPYCEYIYVTDNPALIDDSGWKIVYEPKFNIMENNYAKKYYVKYHPFEYCTTDYIIYIDSSIGINKSLNLLYSEFCKNNYELGGLIIYQNVFEHLNLFLDWLSDRFYIINQINLIKDFCKSLNYNFNYNTCFNATMEIIKKCDRTLKLYEMTFNEVEKINSHVDNIIKSILIDIIFENYSEKIMPIYSSFLLSDYFTKYQHGSWDIDTSYLNMKKISDIYIFNKPVKCKFF